MESVRRNGTANSFIWDHSRHGFSKAVKEMMMGKLPARVDGDMGEVWDLEKLLEERKDP